MTLQVKELENVVSAQRTDIKHLQLKLQGSISVQVGEITYQMKYTSNVH